FPLDAKHLAILSPRRDLHLGGTVERRDLQLIAERRLRHIDRHVEHEVVPLPPEQQVVALPGGSLLRWGMHDDVEIARHPATARAIGRLALAGQADLRAIVDSRRDVHLEALRHRHLAAAVTRRAWRPDHTPFAATLIADTD